MPPVNVANVAIALPPGQQATLYASHLGVEQQLSLDDTSTRRLSLHLPLPAVRPWKTEERPSATAVDSKKGPGPCPSDMSIAI
jgi:hypothetical protein